MWSGDITLSDDTVLSMPNGVAGPARHMPII
jgi:hypothetical protein